MSKTNLWTKIDTIAAAFFNAVGEMLPPEILIADRWYDEEIKVKEMESTDLAFRLIDKFGHHTLFEFIAYEQTDLRWVSRRDELTDADVEKFQAVCDDVLNQLKQIDFRIVAADIKALSAKKRVGALFQIKNKRLDFNEWDESYAFIDDDKLYLSEHFNLKHKAKITMLANIAKFDKFLASLPEGVIDLDELTIMAREKREI